MPLCLLEDVLLAWWMCCNVIEGSVRKIRGALALLQKIILPQQHTATCLVPEGIADIDCARALPAAPKLGELYPSHRSAIAQLLL